jgi:defect in organelle trafficking protein DotC
MRYSLTLALIVSCLCVFASANSFAAKPESFGDIPAPPTAEQLKDVKRKAKPVTDDVVPMPIEIRKDAMREAALSYGARGGLAWRTYHIRQEMETRAKYLDKVYDFRQLLIAAPSGMLIEPPIISESIDAMVIEQGGQNAAVADRVLNIGRNARIVSTARTWRAYLERQWGEVAPPPELLLPTTDEDRYQWDLWFDEGWEAGVVQADEIFQADLDKLTADYQGMIRYRSLLSQGMVSPPYALQVDRGVSGGGNEMRIGDRGLSITGSSLQPEANEWSPVNR